MRKVTGSLTPLMLSRLSYLSDIFVSVLSDSPAGLSHCSRTSCIWFEATPLEENTQCFSEVLAKEVPESTRPRQEIPEL